MTHMLHFNAAAGEVGIICGSSLQWLSAGPAAGSGLTRSRKRRYEVAGGPCEGRVIPSGSELVTCRVCRSTRSSRGARRVGCSFSVFQAHPFATFLTWLVYVGQSRTPPLEWLTDSEVFFLPSGEWRVVPVDCALYLRRLDGLGLVGAKVTCHRLAPGGDCSAVSLVDNE
ncbi:hypothetical protein GWK47_052340 [Chionoecetes opilio]|uniref:Uncharacterized protein n=1 Tax=Chionoecetes opilio TaxID=41210 RepID=A0A8J4Y1F4_CHIOP|nr:hypothetical protein GWK47_052340 [Chionoecetes opilio]